MDFLLVVCSVSLVLIQSTSGEPRIVHYHQKFPTLSANNEVHYSYAYAIDDKASGVVSDRWEERRGEYVKGAYSLLEPGGKVRTVDYQVDGDGGFQAIVKTVVPGQYLLSTQQFMKSKEIHPQPAPELDLGPVFPNLPRNDETVPVNYHALNAQHIGYQRLFGSSLNRVHAPSRSNLYKKRIALRRF
ncbi:uncharacterized protein isoform X2 [Rhodnius prolixus]|uniref:uncharacterized protein isoform X2 n=1 Tax=Rhodnius prolixus TaxID=13249 RepID=UPI003D18C839